MKKILLLLTIALVLIITSFINKKGVNNNLIKTKFRTDTIECGTPERDSLEFENLPWYDNNQYLEDFLDSIGYPQPVNINGPTTQAFANYPTRYWIPIKFWVIREDNGTGGASEIQIRTILRDLNQRYRDNNTLIQFYQKCSISYIDESDNLVLHDAEARGLARNNEEGGAINVFIGNILEGSALGTFYPAFFLSFDSYNAVFLSRRVYEEPNLFGTLSHEVGHYFGLDHTHQYSDRGRCRKEPIDRNREYAGISYCKPLGSRIMCESTGDALRDTPADPDLFSNSSCNYILGGTDSFGDSYQNPPNGSLQPSTINLMSYNQIRSCRNNFTRLQVAVMLHSIERFKPFASAWGNELSLFDTFEPDNTRGTADVIFNCETQDRNFHGQFNFPSIYESCDDDWVRYRSLQNGPIDIYTNAIANRPLVNTIISVYDTNNNLIVSNDDKSGTSTYSKVTINATSSTDYFIKVSNKFSSEKGYYQLSVGKDLTESKIEGQSSFCNNSQNYTISNLPSGTAISWSISPSSGIASLTTSGNTATLTQTGNGIVQLTATTNVGCGLVQLDTKNISIGIPQITAINLSTATTSGYWCANSRGNYFDIELQGGQSPNGLTFQVQLLDPVTYQVFANYTVSGGSGTFALTRPPYTTYLLQARVNDPACGTSETWFGYEMEFVDCSNNYRDSNYNIYPNPASSDLTIEYAPVEELSIEKTTLTSKQKDIKLFNNKGEIMTSSIMKENEVKLTLDTKDIPDGTYFLHIKEGKETIKKQIIIKH